MTCGRVLAGCASEVAEEAVDERIVRGGADRGLALAISEAEAAEQERSAATSASAHRRPAAVTAV